MCWFICIDIGGTAVKHGVMDEGLGFQQSGADETPKGGDAILELICTRISGYLSLGKEIKAVCVSCAGIIDSDAGMVLEANEDLMPDFTGTRIAARVKEKFGLPCFVENDVNCAAMAEYFAGSAKGYRSCLMLTVGTGIGGAFLADGKLWKGHTYSACEVGYLHMEGGSFEELAATSALTVRTAKRLPVDPASISGKWIFEQAQKGNRICIEEIDRMCDILAKGISNLCYVLNPEVIVIGGGISAQKEWLEPRLEAGLDRYLIPAIRKNTRLAFAGFLNYAGMIGACYASGMLESQAHTKRADL